MDRTTLSKRCYADQLEGMRREIATLLASPAKYLDAALTADPTSGVELYERYDNLRDRLRSEFPEFTERLSTRQYRTTRNGSLQRPDLKSLDREIEVLLSLIAA
jgi:hypothetical protein